MLFIYSKVRVRRWCKRPPADGWSSGCAIWGLQVHVYHRLRASRSIPFRIRWRVECWRRRATCVVDKWQKALASVMAHEKRNPAYRGTVSILFLFYLNDKHWFIKLINTDNWFASAFRLSVFEFCGQNGWFIFAPFANIVAKSNKCECFSELF